MSSTTHGMVCAHHHLYSSLARGMPAGASAPATFLQILESIWWRLDAVLDEEIIYWSAALGAAEALLSGTTAIIDHHESPRSIEGSLATIAAACDMVGIRHRLCYGVTDRWDDSGSMRVVSPSTPMSAAAREGLEENRRHLANGCDGMVGVHASFTCGDETLAAAADLASEFGVGVHIHVSEGPEDSDAGRRLAPLATRDWLLVHAVHLEEHLAGTVVHNPRSNMNNSVGYARPVRFSNPVALGTDGIGADMLDEFRIAFARHREHDRNASADTAWAWLIEGARLFPAVLDDTVTWSYDHMDEPWRTAYTTGIKCHDVHVGGRQLVKDGEPVAFDLEHIRAKAAEQQVRLFRRLESL